MNIVYKPKGVCSQLMTIDVENGIIKKVEVKGGCRDNTRCCLLIYRQPRAF